MIFYLSGLNVSGIITTLYQLHVSRETFDVETRAYIKQSTPK